MDFRDMQSPAGAPNTAASAPAKRGRPSSDNKWGRIGVVVGVVAVAVLLVAVAASVSFGGVKSEDKYVDTGRLQAVFLNTGQVYFGNVKALNTKYVVLTHIYYLQTSSSDSSGASASTAGSNVSLVKLGCELHEPLDQMVINREQVTFWENLGDNGQVAKAVATFEKNNPNGQKCADQSSSAPASSTNSTQNAPAASTPSTTTNTTGH